MECKNCGREISKNSNFCSFCGTPIEKEENEHQLLCPNCGNKITKDNKFCKKCGYKLQDDINKSFSINYNGDKEDFVVGEWIRKDFYKSNSYEFNYFSYFNNLFYAQSFGNIYSSSDCKKWNLVKNINLNNKENFNILKTTNDFLYCLPITRDDALSNNIIMLSEDGCNFDEKIMPKSMNSNNLYYRELYYYNKFIIPAFYKSKDKTLCTLYFGDINNLKSFDIGKIYNDYTISIIEYVKEYIFIQLYNPKSKIKKIVYSCDFNEWKEIELPSNDTKGLFIKSVNNRLLYTIQLNKLFEFNLDNESSYCLLENGGDIFKNRTLSNYIWGRDLIGGLSFSKTFKLYYCYDWSDLSITGDFKKWEQLKIDTSDEEKSNRVIIENNIIGCLMNKCTDHIDRYLKSGIFYIANINKV